MKKEKCGIIIQARVGSIRLPGKVLKKVLGRHLLELLIERVMHVRFAGKIALATTVNAEDDAIEILVGKYGFPCFRGSTDVLDNFYRASLELGIDTIVRITGDCPLIDPEVIDGVIELFMFSRCDYVCTSAEFPDGLDTEVFSFSVLEAAWKNAKNLERLHVTPYIWQHATGVEKSHMENTEKIAKFIKGAMLQNPYGNQFNMRWTVDDEKDLEFVTKIYENLYRKNKVFLMKDVLYFLAAHPEIAAINKGAIRDEGYLKDAKNDGYKAAVIGCGWIGLKASEIDKAREKPASHAEMYAMNPKTRIVALCDKNIESLDFAAKIYPGIPRYEDAKKMLEEIMPDIVSIATLADSHCEMIKLCAEYGVKVIICEKPISHDLKSAQEAIDLCKENGSILLINHMRRFYPLIRKFRDWHSSHIGRIKAATVYYGKGLLHTATHFVDILRFFLGEAEWVSATRNDNFSGGREMENDFNADGFIGFKNGVRAAMQSFELDDYNITEIIFFGEYGRLALKKMAGLEIEIVITCPSEGYASEKILACESPMVFREEKSFTWKYLLEHAINCLEGRETPLSSGEDAIAALKILLALKKSAEKNGIKLFLK